MQNKTIKQIVMVLLKILKLKNYFQHNRKLSLENI